MAKTKLHRYERVKHLPNVTFSRLGESELPGLYPWAKDRYQGMELVLELGCGKGEHSLGFAQDNPHKLCLGIDSKSHRICVGAEKAIAQGIENVLFLHGRIERIQEFFKAHSIHEIWLTFPDPHIKTRTIKNRLSGASFLDAYARLLVPGGLVHLKTDSDLLYTYTRESVELWGGRVIAASVDVHGPNACGSNVSETDACGSNACGSNACGSNACGSNACGSNACGSNACGTDACGSNACGTDINTYGDSQFGARHIVSAFEKKARAKGSSIKYMAFKLVEQ